MNLTVSNIKDWKNLLDEMMMNNYGTPDYSQVMSDDQWLDDYTGKTVQDAIDDELDYWDEPDNN